MFSTYLASNSYDKVFQHFFAMKTPTAIFKHFVFLDSLTTFPGLHLALRHLALGVFFKYIIQIIFMISATGPLKDIPNAKYVFNVHPFLVQLMTSLHNYQCYEVSICRIICE
jgi:hypothetical protein